MSEFCDFDKCILKSREESIEDKIEKTVTTLLADLMNENPGAHPGCLERVVSESLQFHSTRLIVKLLEKNHIEKRKSQ